MTWPSKIPVHHAKSYSALATQNCTPDEAKSPVLQPNPEKLFSWSNLLTLIHALAPLEWIFFAFSMLMPSFFNKSTRLRTIWKFSSLSSALHTLEEAAKEATKALFGFIFFIFFLPFGGPITLFFFLVSEVVRYVIKLKYGGKAVKMSGSDAIYGKEDSKSAYLMIAGIVMNGTPSIEKVRNVFRDRILAVRDDQGKIKYHKFRQLITTELGYCIWKDDPNFDIKNHIRIWKDPLDDFEDFESKISDDEPGSRAEDVISRYLDKYGGERLPSDRPQWELVILDSNTTPEGKYAMILRIHHAIGDGVSLVHLIIGSLVDTPITIPSVGATPINSGLRFLTMLWSTCLLPYELWRCFYNEDVNPFHGPSLTGKKRFLMSKGIKFEILKEIKAASETTINDVLMSCLSAALARSFCKRWQFTTPKVTMMMPICYHDVSQKSGLLNEVLVGVLKLPTPLPSQAITPKDRLLLVKEECDRLKRNPGIMSIPFSMKWMCAVLPASFAHFFFSQRGPTMGVSNVPGPQHSVQLFGDTLEGVGVWVPDRSPTGVGIGIISYDGWVRVGLLLDSALISDKADMDLVMKEFLEEVNNLHESFVPVRDSD